MKLGIGIDTGGTYTDAVVYNFEDKKILGSAKALTTMQDLTIGILGAIDGLPRELTEKADIISLSTTLATNACVEDKAGRAKLIFFGGDKKVLDKYGKQFGLPPTDEIYIQESYTQFSGKIDREPDWEQFARGIDCGFEELDGVGIIEMNAVRNGAVVEKKAKEIFKSKYNIPVVCGHELFSELNSIKRGSSTLLNAGLFPVISNFLAAVKTALAVRNIKPEYVVIVRSDGSLMTEEVAFLRPVETLICGPAASAIGCTQLSAEQNSIVVDMGGTTTDLAIIENGVPVTVTSGVTIGKWKTFVNGLYVKTFGLGGDSAVHYDGEKFRLEEYRVVPLCVAAKRYPSVLEDLRKLEIKKHSKFLYEHYMLVKDISKSARYTDEEKRLCEALKKKPLSISAAAAAVNKDIYTVSVERLIKDGVIQVCGLTPTDIMHLKGDFVEYETEASKLGAQFAAFNLGISVEELCDTVYDEVKKKLYINIVKAMLENKYPDYMKNGVNGDVERFITESYCEAKENRDELFSARFKTNYALVGVGAPIAVFLNDVAKLLGTKAVIPQYHEVANALGAIIGNVSAVASVEIKPNTDPEDPEGYTVFGSDENVIFEELEDAISFAVDEAKKIAVEEVKKRGAAKDITVTTDVSSRQGQAKETTVYLGTTVKARASGMMNFNI